MGIGPLFSILVQQKQTAPPDSFWGYLVTWLQSAGGFAAFGLTVWLISAAVGSLRKPTAPSDPRSKPVVLTFPILVTAAAALLVYVFGLFLFLLSSGEPAASTTATAAVKPASTLSKVADIVFAVGGALALAAVCILPVTDLVRRRFSMRRIWALSRLSFQEAIRRRILWVFLVFLLIFLFPPKWFYQIKLEDEVRTNVSVIYSAMTPLLLVVASLLTAFSIPTDLKNQTIHTVVTKPVERFEVVLGRFLGYLSLATIVLAVLSFFSLLMIMASNVSEEAKEESYKARDVVYGDLGFYAKNQADFAGTSVGREWEYRRYISGGKRSEERALWYFADVSALSATDPQGVPCEFSFDIFRTTKGKEGEGVFCTFRFYTPDWKDFGDLGAPSPRQRDYEAKARAVNTAAQPDPNQPDGGRAWQEVNKLAEEFGYYEFSNKEISDYHTLAIHLPPALIKRAQDVKLEKPTATTPKVRTYRMLVEVKCESATQFLGVAKPDLYLLAGEGNFGVNFFKGAFGLWLRLALVVAIAVTCSTYLSGVISWLATVFLFILGFAQEFIAELASGKSIGGGPGEALLRLSRGENLTTQLQESPSASVALMGDKGFQFGMKLLLKLIPDVDQLDWTDHVAEGFNIAWWADNTQTVGIGINLIFTLAYLLPWALLAYYLMKTREVAA
jgi:nitrate reductase gamma subunit